MQFNPNQFLAELQKLFFGLVIGLTLLICFCVTV